MNRRTYLISLGAAGTATTGCLGDDENGGADDSDNGGGGDDSGSNDDDTGEPEPATFQVTIDPLDSPVFHGESVDVQATVSNTGDESDTQEVVLTDVHGELVESTEITLDGGEDESLTFALPPGGYDTDSPGTITVSTDDDEATTDIRSEYPLELADHDAVDVDEDGALLIEATIVNRGSVEASGVLVGEISIDDDHRRRRLVTVPGNRTESVRMKVDHRHDESIYLYNHDAWLEPETESFSEPADAAFLVVTTVDGEGGPGSSADIAVEVENLSDEERTGVLVGEISSSDFPRDFSSEREITVPSGVSEGFEVNVEYETDDETSFVSFFSSAWVEAADT